ncbi:MAG: Hsp33 family molecular chaperone HslO [Paraperlucidibaca sp.]
MSDFLQRFQFQQTPVRGELCRLSEAYQAVRDKHHYPEPVATLLGQAMVAVALMTATLKLEGSLILQIQGDGPVGLIMAECNQSGDVRAIARFDEAESYADTQWTALTGVGRLLLTIEPDDGERYQGIVPLEGASLAEALGYYFQQSEQLPTQFLLTANTQAAAGMMLQVLPGHNNGEDDDLWSRVTQLAATVKNEELLSIEPEPLLYRLFHEETVELFPTSGLRFRCSCSRERSANALVSLGLDELREVAAEQGGVVRVDCQFCHQFYDFDQVDIEQLFQPAADAPQNLH